MKERAGSVVGRVDAGDEMVFIAESGRGWSRRRTELRASAWGLVAMGDLGGYKRGTLRLSWEKIAELHYAPAGHGAVAGLYAREGRWASRCVLPWLGEMEAERVIEAIGRWQTGGASSLTAIENAGGAIAPAGMKRGFFSGWRRDRTAVAVAAGRV